jgi:hypothetical protein
MNQAELRKVQTPLKEKYRQEPESALLTLRAEGRLGEGVICSVSTGRAIVEAGLHPATGGSGAAVCSGDMLLQALVACAGVTSTSEERWGFPERLQWASRRFGSGFTSMQTLPRSSARSCSTLPNATASSIRR